MVHAPALAHDLHVGCLSSQPKASTMVLRKWHTLHVLGQRGSISPLSNSQPPAFAFASQS